MRGLAVEIACWIYDRIPHASLGFQTLYERFYKCKPDLNKVHLDCSQGLMKRCYLVENLLNDRTPVIWLDTLQLGI